MTSNIVRSLLITTGISTVVAGALVIVGISFWVSFILTTVVQVCLWQGFLYVVNQRAALKTQEIERDLLKEYMSNSVDMPCVSCKALNNVPIKLNATNSFKCTACDVDNVIYINIESAAVTTPLESLEIEDTIKLNELRGN